MLFQIAHHQGYIEINWGKLERGVKKAKRAAKKDAEKILPHLADEVSSVSQVMEKCKYRRTGCISLLPAGIEPKSNFFAI